MTALPEWRHYDQSNRVPIRLTIDPGTLSWGDDGKGRINVVVEGMGPRVWVFGRYVLDLLRRVYFLPHQEGLLDYIWGHYLQHGVLPDGERPLRVEVGWERAPYSNMLIRPWVQRVR